MYSNKTDRPIRDSAIGLFLLLLGSFVGCGRNMVSVRGVVTLNGKPLPHATVTFHPLDQQRPAAAQTDASGRFSMGTFEAGGGTQPGAYKVTVAVAQPGAPQDEKNLQRAIVAARVRVHQAPPTIVHENYLLASKTPLEVRVPVRGDLVLALNDEGVK